MDDAPRIGAWVHLSDDDKSRGIGMASAAEQLAANMNMGSFAKATELHKRLLFTLLAMLIYRLGTYVPIPGINSEAFLAFFQNPTASAASWTWSTCSRAAPLSGSPSSP
jgi:hypothetical protein